MDSQHANRGDGSRHADTWIPGFCGRADELGWLRAQWRQVKAGDRGGGPRVAVLLGNPGRGKTRIAQEFYRFLSTHEDPHHYWPDLLDLSRLRLNPPRGGLGGRTLSRLPWLWLGVPFFDPDAHNVLEHNPLLAAMENFRPHVDSIVRLRALRDADRDLMIDSLKALGGLALGPLFTAMDAWSLGRRAMRQRRERRQETALDARAHAESDFDAAVDALLVPLRAALDIGDRSTPTVPMVLLLDDAQWIDRASLAILTRLLHESSRRRWPLLVIATHWESNWREDRPLNPHDISNLDSFADLCAVVAFHPGLPVVTEQVRPLTAPEARAELEIELIKRLPGLTPHQRERLLEHGGGNLRLLVETVRALLRHDRYFVDRDVTQALCSAGEERLRDLLTKTEVYDVVRARFESIEDVAETLAAAALQGQRFLPRLLREVANAVFPGDSRASERIEIGLARSDDPEALIETGEHDAGFAETLYFRIASDYAQDEAGSHFISEVRRALDDRFVHWILSRGFETLPSGERKNLLTLVVNTLGPRVAVTVHPHQGGISDSSSSSIAAAPHPPTVLTRIYAIAALHLIMLHWESGSQGAALNLSAELGAAVPSLFPAVDDGDITASLVYRFADCLAASARYERALTESVQMLNVTRSTGSASSDPPERLLAIAFGLRRVAEIELAVATAESMERARGRLVEAKEICRQIIRREGQSEARLRELSQVTARIADAALESGSATDLDLARSCYRESLDICRRIINVHGETRERLVDLMIASARVGDLGLAVGSTSGLDDARRHYEAAYGIARRMLDRFGETPSHLAYIHAMDVRWGRLELHKEGSGAATSARRHFLAAIDVGRLILHRFGESPARLQALALSLCDCGDAELALGTSAAVSDARDCYREALETFTVIIDQFGASPQRLIDLSHAHLAAGDAETRLGTTDSRRAAHAHFSSAVAIMRRVNERFGETSDRLGGLANALRWLADHPHDADMPSAGAEAAALHQEALDICRRVVDTYSETTPNLTQLRLSLERSGDDLARSGLPGALASARHRYMESLLIARRLIDQFGATPDRLQSLSISLRRIGDIESQLGAPGNLQEARSHYIEALALSRSLVDSYGESRERLRGIASSLLRLGELNRRHNTPEHLSEGLVHLNNSITTLRQIIRLCGEDMESLADLATGLSMLADLTLSGGGDGCVPVCLGLHLESLQLHRLVIDRFGMTPHRLRDVAHAHFRVGWLTLCIQSEDAIARAHTHFVESIDTHQHLIERFGVTPERLGDLAGLLDELGEIGGRIKSSQGPEWARVCYGDLLEVRRLISAQFPKTLKSSQNLLAALMSCERFEPGCERRRQLLDEATELADRLSSAALADESSLAEAIMQLRERQELWQRECGRTSDRPRSE